MTSSVDIKSEVKDGVVCDEEVINTSVEISSTIDEETSSMMDDSSTSIKEGEGLSDSKVVMNPDMLLVAT